MPSSTLCFDYESAVPSLRRLAAVAQRTQWTTDDIDWSREAAGSDYIRILEWHGALRSEYVRALSHAQKERLARQLVAFDCSQILHGEQGAMMLAGQLVNSVEDLDARLYAATQVKDEARHVDAVRHIVRRIGPIYPCGPAICSTLEYLLKSPIWPKQVLGLQLFLEARALLSFREHLLFVDDPIFREAILNIERDESQHVAFGIKYLRTGVEALDEAGRKEMLDYGLWLHDHIWVLTQSSQYRAPFDECGLDYDEFRATIRPTSSLHPDMGRATRKNVSLMQQQFRLWFVGVLGRIGLDELVARIAAQTGEVVPKAQSAEDGRGQAEVLPWVGGGQDMHLASAAARAKRRRPARARG